MKSDVSEANVLVYGNVILRDGCQVARALRILLAPLHLGEVWTDDGPAARAVEPRGAITR